MDRPMQLDARRMEAYARPDDCEWCFECNRLHGSDEANVHD